MIPPAMISRLGRGCGARWRGVGACGGAGGMAGRAAGGVWADRRGAAVLEFALVAPLFIALLMAILQLALVFVGQAGLESAARDSARLLQGGQPQMQGWDAGAYKRAVCGSLPPFMACGNLAVDVSSVARLADAASLPPFSASAGGAYAPGGADALVVVRLAYSWPTGAMPLGLNLADQPDGSRMLLATQMFRTQPYEAVP